jgi:hypothetical protein
MPELKVNQEEIVVGEQTRTGTWFSLGILATVLIATYGLFFWLYMSRV